MIAFALLACGEGNATQTSPESNNWYDTDGSGGLAKLPPIPPLRINQKIQGISPMTKAETKPDEVQTPGLSWSATVDLGTETGTLELTYTDDDLSECTARIR